MEKSPEGFCLHLIYIQNDHFFFQFLLKKIFIYFNVLETNIMGKYNIVSVFNFKFQFYLA